MKLRVEGEWFRKSRDDGREEVKAGMAGKAGEAGRGGGGEFLQSLKRAAS